MTGGNYNEFPLRPRKQSQADLVRKPEIAKKLFHTSSGEEAEDLIKSYFDDEDDGESGKNQTVENFLDLINIDY